VLLLPLVGTVSIVGVMIIGVVVVGIVSVVVVIGRRKDHGGHDGGNRPCF